MSWKNKTNVFAKKFVSRQIGEATWNFYPVSVGRVFELRETIKDLFTSMSALFASNKDDVGQEIEKITQAGGEIQRTNISAISVELAMLRDKQRKESIGAAIEALLSERNKIMLGRLLADSLREEFSRDCPDDEIKSFMSELDLGTLVEFLMGFVEANAKVFGPLGERVRATVQSKLAELAPGSVASPATANEAVPSTPAP